MYETVFVAIPTGNVSFFFFVFFSRYIIMYYIMSRGEQTQTQRSDSDLSGLDLDRWRWEYE